VAVRKQERCDDSDVKEFEVKRSLFDGCHHNNELTGIVCAQKIKTSLCRVCPFVKPYIFATSMLLTDATSKDIIRILLLHLI